MRDVSHDYFQMNVGNLTGENEHVFGTCDFLFVIDGISFHWYNIQVYPNKLIRA